MNQNRPTQSIQSVRKNFKTLQITAIFFAALTMLGVTAAALSGFQINRLHNRLEPPPVPDSAAEDALKEEIAGIQARLTDSQQQLAAEKNRGRSLSAKIVDLENQLKVLKQPAQKPEVRTPSRTGEVGLPPETPPSGAGQVDRTFPATPPLIEEPANAEVAPGIESHGD